MAIYRNNKKVSAVFRGGRAISRIYKGEKLVFQSGSGPEAGYVPKYNFSGKFADDSTEADWKVSINYYTNKIQSSYNKVTINIADKVNPETKIFDFDINEILDTDTYKYGFILYQGSFSLIKIEKIYNLYSDESISLASCFNCNRNEGTLIEFKQKNNRKITVKNFYSCFENQNLLKELDLSYYDVGDCTNFGGLCNYNFSLEKINLEGWNFNNASSLLFVFTECYSLKDVIGPVNNIKTNITLNDSPLTNDSAMVFIDGLANVEQNRTIRFNEATYDTLTEDQIAIATNKGWTVQRG